MLKHILPAALLLLALAAPPARALRIEDAVTQALGRNERAQSADQDARAAAARVARARAMLLPSLRLDGDYARLGEGVSSSSRAEGLEGRLSAEQTIFNARAFPLLAQALRGRDAARLQAGETRRQLAFATAEAFLGVLGEEQVAQAASRREELARRSLDEIRVRFNAQLVGSNDVTRAELEAATAERERVRAVGTARVARLRLADLLGAEVRDSLETPAWLLDQAAQAPRMPTAAEAAGVRPDLQAARARLEALRRSALEPLARWVPDLSLSGTTSAAEDDGLSSARDNWTLSLGLGWQIFDGGGREADRAERLALARSAEYQLAGLERGVGMELEATRTTLETGQASLDRAGMAREAARRNAAETGELYRRGLARALEVVDANVQLFEAEADLARARTSLAAAYLGFRKAAGLEPFEKETRP
jgi:outer membrane protein TolC